MGSSTESSTASWPREVTSPLETEPVASPSTEPSSPMRTSSTSTPEEAFSPWPTLDQTPTDLNSSSASVQPHISTENTPFSARSPMAWTSSTNSKPSALALERPPSHASSRNADSSEQHERSINSMVDKDQRIPIA